MVHAANKCVSYLCLIEFVERNGYPWNAPAADDPDGARWIAERIGRRPTIRSIISATVRSRVGGARSAPAEDLALRRQAYSRPSIAPRNSSPYFSSFFCPTPPTSSSSSGVVGRSAAISRRVAS